LRLLLPASSFTFTQLISSLSQQLLRLPPSAPMSPPPLSVRCMDGAGHEGEDGQTFEITSTQQLLDAYKQQCEGSSARGNDDKSDVPSPLSPSSPSPSPVPVGSDGSVRASRSRSASLVSNDVALKLYVSDVESASPPSHSHAATVSVTATSLPIHVPVPMPMPLSTPSPLPTDLPRSPATATAIATATTPNSNKRKSSEPTLKQEKSNQDDENDVKMAGQAASANAKRART